MSYHDVVAVFSDTFDDMCEIRKGRPNRLSPRNERILILGWVAQLVRELEAVRIVGILVRVMQIEGCHD